MYEDDRGFKLRIREEGGVYRIEVKSPGSNRFMLYKVYSNIGTAIDTIMAVEATVGAMS